MEEVSTARKLETAQRMHDSEAAYNEDFPNMHYETDRPKWPEFKGKKLVLRMPITNHKKLSNMT